MCPKYLFYAGRFRPYRTARNRMGQRRAVDTIGYRVTEWDTRNITESGYVD